MLGGEIGGGASRLVVGDEVDAALPPELHILAAVTGDAGKSHSLKGRLEDAALGGAELEELEALHAQWILE